MPRVAPALLAVGAAALWGMGTVLGRRMSSKLDFQALTAWRFTIGLPASWLIWTVETDGLVAPLSGNDTAAIVLLAMIPGLAAMLMYYRGLDDSARINRDDRGTRVPSVGNRHQLRRLRIGSRCEPVARTHSACGGYHDHGSARIEGYPSHRRRGRASPCDILLSSRGRHSHAERRIGAEGDDVIRD